MVQQQYGIVKPRFLRHISPVLLSLHWLPKSQRIKFKLATTAYKVLATGQPDNPSSFKQCYNPVRHCTLLLSNSWSHSQHEPNSHQKHSASPAMGHWGTCPSSTFNNIFSADFEDTKIPSPRYQSPISSLHSKEN